MDTSNLAKITNLKHVVDRVRKTLAAIIKFSSANKEINNSDSDL
jgi:hypothetical protein